ncbi:peptidylprolyl isomerase [Clostridium saccharobutylicum]|uniref:Peptidyl-prolyl cis-trans isomerase n=1 Tax=Clostridium saccharobutylicum DSM 13864 TaxID=1345695 RepID=U5MWX5_CLOSA|nr:peptidylprolyl isomerase [Clostridium saccharobutylicum]AGX45033.1 peptidyl-prolyl cis-trans isomerase B [Clostridium saccharobutylicum DSM 13864]AQR92315.1 putative peptidyl-prolyl cis-trans isomerase [Clostridium saccharobutylicum]AQS02217.1 putative peptidyl-prolyl cis-trans isomerase [Clostridium saccharobutylicum]AQS16200.1 putative peptidyl-prolyl cis-trans isomerase [Clostridium saccharobutylicum]MBA2903819.1 peptidyl-prolyl cis-trans isomerase B (cyclophilin B) [Clostridium saccharo
MRMKNIKKYLNLVTVVVIMSSLVLVGCGNKNTQSQGDSTSVTDESSDSKTGNENLPVVTITVENYGVIQAELYPEIAPNTVNNFINLVKKGFYDNLTFHRIIKGFMIQGGDPKGDGTGGPGYSIEGEFTSNGFANSLKHTKGVLSMARTQDPNSAGSQFFIMTGDAPNLDGQYAAFGKVTSGLDVLEKIQSVKTKSNDAPIDKVVIKSITVDTKGVDYKEPKKK